MRHHSWSIGFATACGLMAGGVTSALAAFETWVSPTGTDAGNCQINAPCRTFQFAHDRTNNNGAINVLASGNFGPLTINRAISIVAQGVEAVINTSADGAAITVRAGDAAIVSLRGLTIDLRGIAHTGISFFSGAALHVQNTVIRKTANRGINFAPSSGIAKLFVTDTVVANAHNGIVVAPNGGASAKVAIDRVRVENGTDSGIVFSGLLTNGTIVATVRDTAAVGNTDKGITAGDLGGGSTTVMIDRSAAVENGTGVIAGNALIFIGDSTVTRNGVGMSFNSGGEIRSYGSNQVDGNGAGNDPSGTISPD